MSISATCAACRTRAGRPAKSAFVNSELIKAGETTKDAALVTCLPRSTMTRPSTATPDLVGWFAVRRSCILHDCWPRSCP